MRMTPHRVDTAIITEIRSMSEVDVTGATERGEAEPETRAGHGAQDVANNEYVWSTQTVTLVPDAENVQHLGIVGVAAQSAV